MDAVRKRNGTGLPVQSSLFERQEENPPLREAIDFYRHAHGWSNRLIAGDSLLVMNSLLEKEGMAGQVQMAYIDPPYGIKYGSNFQPFITKRRVSENDADEDLTSELETLKAFQVRHFFFAGALAFCSMCRVDSIGVGTSNLGQTFKLFLEHGQFRGPNPSIVYFLINAPEIGA